MTPPLTVRTVFVNDQDQEIHSVDLPFSAGPTYVYQEGTVVAPKSAVAMDLVLAGNLHGEVAFFDDLRVLDANLLVNPGFESRSPTGRNTEEIGRAHV